MSIFDPPRRTLVAGGEPIVAERCSPYVCKCVDPLPGIQSLPKTHFAGKELQSGKKMERAIQPEIPSPSCRADERMREHREASTRTRLKPHSAVQVAVPTRATGRASRRDGVDTEFPRIQTS